jgi:dTDP-4-dehydrorhamnose 3,5-epimerase
MKFIKTSIPDLIQIIPDFFIDERGVFFEAYNQRVFKDNNIDVVFVQDNQSFSFKNVLRGLHFQLSPFEQGKLVSVSKGRVLDVAVDLRKESPTFGSYEAFELNGEKRNMLYIPPGFAHGFVALEDSVLGYKCTGFYNKAYDSGIIWNDENIGINWGIKNPILSEKDKNLKTFRDYINLI